MTPPSATDSSPAIPPERFREVFAHWAAHVALVAVRHDGRVYGTTVTSLTPVAADPPTVLVALGGGAQVLPFLEPGARFVVSLLSRDQARLAQIFADSFPVGPSPFATTGDPTVEGAMATLVCQVRETFESETGSRLVLGRVIDATVTPERPPLLYRRRRYAGMDEPPA